MGSLHSGSGLPPQAALNWYLGALPRPLIQLPIPAQVAIKDSDFGLKEGFTSRKEQTQEVSLAGVF